MRGIRQDFERALTFMRTLDDIWCPRRERFRWGTAFFSDDFPTQWDFNFLRLDSYPGRLTAKGLAREADRVQGGAGIEHRKVYVENESVGTRLREGFEDLGWVTDRLVVMAHRDAERRADTAAAGEIDWEVVQPLRYRFARSAPWAKNERVVEENVRGSEWAGRAVDARYFGVTYRNELVSVCDLYSDGTAAQIEDVGTLDEHTGRGYAKAVVQLAVDEALEQGCDLVFLVADADDWPQDMYAKVGFEPVGYVYDFVMSDAHPKAPT